MLKETMLWPLLSLSLKKALYSAKIIGCIAAKGIADRVVDPIFARAPLLCSRANCRGLCQLTSFLVCNADSRVDRVL